eukprot:TRINITY_DN832_c0_g1_i4.p1 TRINITY_DN832_c0_g1~~TRINITY_DN832_c0_g1_i4.p1  ORF type:complete len:519 (-),score=87.21 TRINITY_DN832_c0_g1_i4:2117-3673(-)
MESLESESKLEKAGSDKKLFGFIYDLLVLDVDEERVLAEVLAGNRLRIPRFVDKQISDTIHNFNTVEEFLELETGIPGYLLRGIWGRSRKQSSTSSVCSTYHGLYVIETDESNRTCQSPWEWIDRTKLAQFEWGNEKKYEYDAVWFVEDIFKNATMGNDDTEPNPWDRLGWYGAMMSWARRELETKGITIVSRPRKRVAISDRAHIMQCDVMRSSPERSIKRAKVSEKMFIKCTVPRFKEVDRTSVIARVVGDIAVEVLGANKELGVSLLGDAGSLDLETLDQDAVVETVIKMQKRSASRIDELVNEGLEVQDGKWVEENIERIVNHPSFGKYHAEWDVEEEMRYLRSKVEFVQSAGRYFSTIQGPNRLVHGDLSCENIGKRLVGGEKLYRLYDWEYSFVGSPFHDCFGLTFGMYDKKPQLFRKMLDAIDEVFWRGSRKHLCCDDETLEKVVNVVKDTILLNHFLEYSEHFSAEWSKDNDCTAEFYVITLFESVASLEDSERYKKLACEAGSERRLGD